jgi:hypothetical protein
MTQSQLTSAIQLYMNTQDERPHGFGSRTLSQPA